MPWMRVAKRTIVGLSADRSTYTIALELTNAGILQRGGGGDPGGFPLPKPSCEPTTAEVVQSVAGSSPTGSPTAITLPSAPTVGNTLIAYQTIRQSGESPTTPVGFTDSGAGVVAQFEHKGSVAYRVVQAGDTDTIEWPTPAIGFATPELVYLEERVGVLTPIATSFVSADPLVFGPGDFDGAAITPGTGKLGYITGYWFAKRDEATLTAGSGWSLLDAVKVGAVIEHAVVQLAVSSTSGTYTPKFHTSTSHISYDDHDYAAITVALLCDASGADNPPSPGQWVRDEIVTMTGASGTTQFPFATGSLSVKVDQTDQTGAIVSQDGATGDFTLAFDPTPHEEVVTVSYQGR